MPPQPAMPRKMAFDKYLPFDPLELRDRTWPDKSSRKRPAGVRSICGTATRRSSIRWTRSARAGCSTRCVKAGFKEVEVGFPSASQPDYDFVRLLIERHLIPTT